MDQLTNAPKTERMDRRDAVRHLGKFAAYAAPFTVLALTAKKASAASGNGPTPSGAPHPASRH